MVKEFLNFISQSLYSLIRSNESRMAMRLRSALLKTDCLLDTGVHIVNPENFSAGRNCALYHGSYILNHHGTFSMSDNSHLGAYCYVNVCHGRLIIGEDVAIGPGTKIIAYSNHFKTGQKVTDVRLTADVTIGKNVFIGANCSILPGTTIEDNVVVAAGAVVKGTLLSNNIYGGSPAKIIKAGWYA